MGQPAPAPQRAATSASTGEQPDTRAFVLWTLGALVAVVAAGWIVLQTLQVLLLVYLSGLLATGLSPIVTRFERAMTARLPGRMRLPRWAAILFLYLAVLGLVGTVVAMVLPPLITQARQLIAQAPALLAGWQQVLLRYGILQHDVSMSDVVGQAPDHGDAFSALLLATWSIVGGLAGFVTVLVLTYYLLVEADDVFSGFVRLFPRPRRLRVRGIASAIAGKISAWLSGQLILAGVVGTTTAVGLGVLGVPYFYVLALVAALGETIPYLGPLLAAVPAVCVAATVSLRLAVVVAGFLLVLQQVENHLVAPAVMQQQVGLSVVAVIVAILMGSHMLGIVGVVIAVPTAAILQVLVQELRPSSDERATS